MPVAHSMPGFPIPPQAVGITPYINIQDQKPNSTTGGGFTNGAWRTRDLNTIVANVGGYAALSSNQISLAPGIYICDITAPGWQVDDHVIRLQNITTSSTIAEGVNARSNASSNHEVSRLRTSFTLTSLSILEVQHQCETTNGTDGFGRVSNFTTNNEIYTVAEFWKVDGLTTPPPVGDYTISIYQVPYVHVQDRKTQNTQGGSLTASTWNTRVLNTIVTDTTGQVSLSSNRITIPAGTWRIKASAPAYTVSVHQTRLQNITDASTILTGTSEAAAGTQVTSRSMVSGRFTIASAKAIELQHNVNTTNGTNGAGIAANFTTEVYAEVELWKEA